ncbi:general substrate transporter [Naematelia encephala]|uniref:General substrate transporter n=1 Tax=Naematelia encephala TaxID=71784 RepID=A0A1Y2BLW6_9TREE|nr:general substrate transporter [Naematelia encephala]
MVGKLPQDSMTMDDLPNDDKIQVVDISLPANDFGLSDERIQAAQEDARRQASMSVRDGLRKYRSAAMWAFLMSLTYFMESYDYGLMGSLFGFPAFAKKYGTRTAKGTYNVSATQQTVLKQITKCGQLIGLYFAGSLNDRFGYKWTMLGSLALIVPIVFMQFFAPSAGVLIAAQFLIGIPLAPFLTLANVYAAEVSPLSLQPYLTSLYSLSSSMSSFIATGLLRGLLHSSLTNSYRIAFAVQWIWLPPLAVVVWFAPESPTWCIRAGQMDRARIALKRLSGPDETDEQIENRLALLQYTDALEKHYSASTSYLECFRGTNLRRTEIAAMVYSAENLDGYDIASSTTYFFQQAGLSATQSFDLGLGNNAISFVCTFIAWWFMRYIGRRKLFVFALFSTVIILLAIGGLGVPEPTVALGWATGGICFLFTVIFKICQGPLTYTIVTDIPSTRLRAKTVVIARAGFLCSAVFMATLVNYQINATAWNWRGKAGFFWAGFCLLVAIWSYFRLPETKDRTPAQLDKLFADGVPARIFASQHVDTVEYTEESTGQV